MSTRSPEGRGGWVNEDLRDYEGFPAILSLLDRGARGLEDQLQPQLPAVQDVRAVADDIRATVIPISEDQRAAHERLINALRARPDVADLVQRLQKADEELRSRIVSALFPPPDTEGPHQA